MYVIENENIYYAFLKKNGFKNQIKLISHHIDSLG
jgi:hypothetical protein